MMPERDFPSGVRRPPPPPSFPFLPHPQWEEQPKAKTPPPQLAITRWVSGLKMQPGSVGGGGGGGGGRPKKVNYVPHVLPLYVGRERKKGITRISYYCLPASGSFFFFFFPPSIQAAVREKREREMKPLLIEKR
jgi:hypothetical protein